MNVNELALSLRWRQPGGIIALLFILGTFSAATGQTSLDVHVTNIAIAGELSARGLTAAFPHPVLATISVTDDSGKPVLGLADTSRWLAPQDLAEVGIPVSQIWKRLLEYHRAAPSFPSNPDIYQQNPAPLLTEFRQTTPFPTSTMLVMDVSGSMSEELADAKSAARLFVDLLRPIDRAGVVQFSHTIAAFQEFTNDKQKLLAIIDSAKADGATALYDALVYAVQATRRENSRRAIIVYTDGVDISSTLTPTAVIDSARFYSTPIFTIALGTGTNPDTLKRIARETGGLFFQTQGAVEFKAIYQRIAALIQNFYMLAYTSPDPARNNTWRRLEVTVCDEQKRLGASTGDYFVAGGLPLRDTDLTPALTSFTSLTILENGRPVKAVRPGDHYTYRLRVSNLGPERAESVRLHQLLPPSVNFIGTTNLPFYTTRDSLVWQIPRLNAGATDSITVTAQFAANAPPNLQQLISRLTSSARNDNTPNNDTARDTVRASFATPTTFTDLAITQFVKTDSFVVSGKDTVYFAGSGGTIDYRVVIANLGLIAARNVRVTDFLPDSVRASNFQPSPAGANADSVLWTIASLPSQSSASFTFNATVAPKMPVGTNWLINQATVKADNEDPAKLANNTTIDTVFNIIKPPLTDLALALNSRTISTIIENGRIVNAVKPGEPIDYKIRVRNPGPELANSIRVRQLLPDSVRFVAASKPLVTINRDSLIWQIPSLASGGVDSITISVLFAVRVPPTLTQLISRANLASPNDVSPVNNAASDTVRVVIPPRLTDLAIALNSRTNSTIIENNRIVNAVKPGEPIDYKIRVRNLGPEQAPDIRVRQLFPDSVRFIAASKPLAIINRDSLIWQIPLLNAGGADSITVSVLFASRVPPTLTHLVSRADLIFANEIAPANNSASDTIRVVIPPAITDLALAFNSRTNSTIVENGRIVNAVKPGEPIGYKIRVRNLGPELANSIRVRQLLPDSVHFVAASKPLAVTSRDSLIWQIPQLASGGVDSITISVLFAARVPPTLTRLISRANLTSPNDISPANNAASDTVRVVIPPRLTDLAIAFNSRTNSTIVENGRIVNAVKPGEPIDYKIRVRNPGPELANSIRVRQLLPDSVRFVAASKPLVIINRDSLIWQIPQLASGGVDSITISVLFAARVPPTLTRLISRANLTSPNDISPANNSASDTIRVVIPPAITDLALAFNSRTNSTIVENGRIVNAVKPGEPIDYKIRVRNPGPELANSIRVRQLLPDSVRFVAASKPLVTINRDSLIWQIPSLASGGVDSITISVLFATAVPPTLTRLISRANLTSPNDVSPANNSASDTIRVVIPPAITDLTLAFNSRTNSTIVENGRIVNAVKPGEPIDYKIRVRNPGPELANSIRVRQLLPDSVRFVAASKPLATINRDSLIWQIPQLASGSVDSITISVLFAARVPPTLTRLISRANLTSPNDVSPANNAASDTVRVVIPPRLTDLAIAFNSRTNSTIVENNRIVNAVKPGEPIDYKIRVRNPGPELANSIRVRQLLPDSVRFVAASKPLATINRDSLIWQIPSLASGGVDSITISVLFAARVPPTLTRLISRANLSSPNDVSPANNSASDTIRVVIPPAITDLALAFNSRTNSTIVENGRIVNAVKPGEPIDYKIRVRNPGPEQAGNIRVRQLLPDSVRFVAASKPLAIINRDSLIWQIPQLASGGVDSITISVLFAGRVPPTLTQLISRANLTSPNDISPANNAASDTVRVVIPPAVTDLALTFNSRTMSTIVENGRIVNAVKPGEPIDYKIRVSNPGPELANSIRVRQLLPDSVRFVAASKPLATINRDSLIWQIPQLASGGVDSITISVLFAARVPPTLTRLISRANLTSPNDISPANNSATDTVRVVIPPPLPPTDLAVTLASQTGLTIFENGRNVNAAKPGQRYDYRLRVRNFGPARAENIRLRQSLPDSVRFVAASQPPALATRDSLIWEITSLNAGGSDSINVSVQFAPSVPQNLARLISRLTLFAANDNSPTNNVARDTVRVVIPPPPGSRPRIEARPPEVTIGDSVRVRVQVLAPVVTWELWVYYANGQIDSSYAEAYIKTTRLTPNVWLEVTPIFTNTRLFTAAKEEDIRFEIRSLDIFGDFATASDAVLVRSSNDLVLERNVYEADRQSPLGINFRLSSNRSARLEVYDLNGVCISKLVEAPFNAGWNTYNWNGQTETGRPVGSGVYIIALRSGEFNAWKKCIIVR